MPTVMLPTQVMNRSVQKTNAAETVKVVYDPKTVDLNLLLDLYFKTIDPTSLNRQGNDREHSIEPEFII